VDAAEAAIEVKEEEFRAKVLKEKAEKRAERTRLKEERAIKQRGAIRLNRDTKALRAMQAQAKVQRARLARSARMTAWLDALEAESQAWITEDKVRCAAPRQAGCATCVPADANLVSPPHRHPSPDRLHDHARSLLSEAHVAVPGVVRRAG